MFDMPPSPNASKKNPFKIISFQNDKDFMKSFFDKNTKNKHLFLSLKI